MTEKNKDGQKKKKKKFSKQEYLDVASIVFQEKGYHNTKIEDITSEVGSSVGNFYRYFKVEETEDGNKEGGKNQIFKELITGFYNDAIQKIRELTNLDNFSLDEPMSISKEITRVLREFIETFSKNDKLAIIFLEKMGGINEDYANVRNEFLDNISKEIEDVFRLLKDIGLLRTQNIKISAQIWLGSILETVRCLINSNYEIKIDELVDELTRYLIIGALKKRN